MPWNGKRTLKPLATSETCLCSDCGGACGEPTTEGTLRCEDCLYFVSSGKHATAFDWSVYCKSNHSIEAHGDPRGLCGSEEEHKSRLAEESAGISQMLRTLDHAMEVGSDAKWGQMTFESLARET